MKKTSPARRTRRGFTLGELSISMAFGSAVMMIAVGLVQQSFRWSTTVSHRRADDLTFFRLSSQLRDDILIAADADLSPAADSAEQLTLLREDETSVTYTIADQTITRLEPAADQRVRREVYRWKTERLMKISIEESAGQIRLEIKTAVPHSNESIPVWRCVGATIGLRLRHQNGDIRS